MEEYEELNEESQHICQLLHIAGVEEPISFLFDLYEMYSAPQMHDFEQYHLNYITENLKHYGSLAKSKMREQSICVDNMQLKKQILKCKSEMDAILEQAPTMDGVVSALINRSVEKKLIRQGNEVIRRFNSLLPLAVREEQEKLQQYEQKIKDYELSRIQSFNPYLEYALELNSLLFEDAIKEEARDYRLRYFDYPPEYEEFKAQYVDKPIIVEKNAKENSSQSARNKSAVYADLKSIKELLDSGVLTQDLYESERESLLKELNGLS